MPRQKTVAVYTFKELLEMRSRKLEEDYEYLTSDECLLETCEANEYEFYIDRSPA